MFRGIGTLVVGAAIGAAYALLNTPRTGVETRAQLQDRITGLKGQYGDTIGQGRIRATELIKSGRELLDEKLAVGQDLVNTAIEKARTTMEEVQATPSNKEQASIGESEKRETESTHQPY